MATALTNRPPRTGQIAVDTAALVVLGENDQRIGAVLFNNGPATVYVSFTPNVDIYRGLGIPAGAGISFDAPHALYAVAAATGSTLSFMEETR